MGGRPSEEPLEGALRPWIQDISLLRFMLELHSPHTFDIGQVWCRNVIIQHTKPEILKCVRWDEF